MQTLKYVCIPLKLALILLYSVLQLTLLLFVVLRASLAEISDFGAKVYNYRIKFEK